MFHERTMDAAKGKWRGILLELGLPDAALKDRHGPCPLCDSKDNFRFDNREGNGTWICTCGAGNGMNLAIAYTGREFRDVAKQVDGIVGNVKVDSVRPAMSDGQRKDILRDTWKATQPIEVGDAVHRYLERRGIDELIYPSALRFAPNLRDGAGGVHPAMVAMVGVHGQDKFVSMHRTFLKSDGSGKAEIPSPRKLMPGSLPAGACVMLSEYVPGGPLGIAEGIETAMSASALYSMPVWAAINSTLLAKWVPPEGCDEIAIFGDNDAKFGGQKAAFALAHSLAVKGKVVTTHIPEIAGQDWNDIHLKGWRRTQ